MFLHYYFYVYLSNQKSTAVCIFLILMLTYSFTFCTLVHLGEFYFSEMQYTVVFSFYNYFSIMSSSMVYLKISFGLYHNDWTTFAEQVVNYLNKIINCSVNINSIIHRVPRLHK